MEGITCTIPHRLSQESEFSHQDEDLTLGTSNAIGTIVLLWYFDSPTFSFLPRLGRIPTDLSLHRLKSNFHSHTIEQAEWWWDIYFYCKGGLADRDSRQRRRLFELSAHFHQLLLMKSSCRMMISFFSFFMIISSTQRAQTYSSSSLESRIPQIWE